MKILYKVLLANIGISVLIALILTLTQGQNNHDPYILILALTWLGVGMVDLFIAIVLFIAGKEYREWAQGFLLSWALLMLVGFAVCTSTFKFSRS